MHLHDITVTHWLNYNQMHTFIDTELDTTSSGHLLWVLEGILILIV